MSFATTNPETPLPAVFTQPATVVGGNGPTQEQKAKKDAEQQALLDRQMKDGNALKNLFALLLALFLNEKMEGEAERKSGKKPEENGEDKPLSRNNDFIMAFASSIGVDTDRLRDTMTKVRSGETSAFSAAVSTYTSAMASPKPFTNEDLAKAERAVTQYAAKGNPLLEMIASKESGGNYNITFGGKQMPLTNMTVDQVIAWQEKQIKAGAPSTACGKYQIICPTLKGLKAELAKKGEHIGNMQFDEKMQERLGMRLLERRGLEDFKSGKISEATFMRNLSQEWAALPKDMSGKSYYHGDGLNKAHINPAVMLMAMRATKDDGPQGSQLQQQFAQGGVAQKPSPANLTAAWKPSGTDQTVASVGVPGNNFFKPAAAVFKTGAPT